MDKFINNQAFMTKLSDEEEIAERASEIGAWAVSTTKNSAASIVFREELLIKRYPGKWIILVMDNASYHKSESALTALSLVEDQLVAIWLPPYCSDLNPIECF